MKVIFGTILVCLTLANVQGQAEGCRTLDYIPRHFLSLETYIGVWYPQGFGFYETQDVQWPPYKCPQFNYSVSSENNLIADQIMIDLNTGLEIYETDQVVIENIEIPALWKFYSNSSGTLLESNAVILHTDHVNFALQYFCTIVDAQKFERMVMWSRERVMDSKLAHFVEALMIGYGIPISQQVRIIQGDC